MSEHATRRGRFGVATKTITIRLSTATLERVEELAKAQRRSRTAQIEVLLEHALDLEQPDAGRGDDR